MLNALGEVLASVISDDELIQNRYATAFILDWMDERFRFLRDTDLIDSRHLAPSSADQLTFVVAATLKTYPG